MDFFIMFWDVLEIRAICLAVARVTVTWPVIRPTVVFQRQQLSDSAALVLCKHGGLQTDVHCHSWEELGPITVK